MGQRTEEHGGIRTASGSTLTARPDADFLEIVGSKAFSPIARRDLSAPPPRRRVVLPMFVGAVVMALIAGAVGAYLWQQRELRQVEAARADTVAALAQSQQETTTLTKRAEELQTRAARLEETSAGLRQELRTVARAARGQQAQFVQLEERLVDTQSELVSAEEALQGARGTISSMVGAPLADGIHWGWIRTVVAAESPPRVVFDQVRVLTGTAAVEAAVDEGIIQPGQDLSGGYYIRNTRMSGRVVELSPHVRVLVRGKSGLRVVGLREFGRIFRSNKSRDEIHSHHLYRVATDAGVITRVKETKLS